MFIPEKSRNSFWIRVLRNVNANKLQTFKVPRRDTESSPSGDTYRSLQPVYHLKLGVLQGDHKPSPTEVSVSEDSMDFKVFIHSE